MAIQKSYWVIPGRFRAGDYPGSKDEDEARAKLRWLLNLGIDVFIDLTEMGEYGLEPYNPLLLEEARSLKKNIQYIRHPIKDFSIPPKDQVERIISEIDQAMEAGQQIYLHCLGGKGRTGSVVGCYLAEHGYPGQAALDRIIELRQGLPNADDRSPETPGQRKLVEEWKTLKVSQ
jgi:hypothetical protein